MKPQIDSILLFRRTSSHAAKFALAGGLSIAGAAAWLGSAPKAIDWIASICSDGPMFATPAGLSEATGRPATTVKPLSCEKLAHMPGKAVTTVLVTLPPLAFTPAHRHPGSVTAFVVSGAVRSQLAGTEPQGYPAGSTWFEPAQALHLFAENPSASQTAILLAVFVTDENCGPLVIPEPPSAAQ
jgi:quercetin dioxygenase-like cupin family protein